MGRRRMRAGGGLVAVGGLMGESITKVLPLFGRYYPFRVVLQAVALLECSVLSARLNCRTYLILEDMRTISDYLLFTFVHGRRKRDAGENVSSVELRVTHRKSQRYLSTGVRCRPSEWDGSGVRGRADAAELNARLAELLLRARSVEDRLRERGEMTLEGFVASMREACGGGGGAVGGGAVGGGAVGGGAVGGGGAAGGGSEARGWWEFCDERAAVRCHGRSRWTEVRYRKLLAWLRERFAWRRAADVREVDVVRMDGMLAAAGVSEGTRWHNYHRYLKALLADAVRDGLIRRNPYEGVGVARPKDDGRALDRCLTADELARIRAVELPTGHLSRVRDLFIFQCYTCMGFADLRDFDAERLVEVEGRLVYSSRRYKTGCKFTFVLLHEAEEVLERYGGKLPVISAQKYNVYLKEVARRAGVEKPLSSHWARHTGATMLLNAGVRMDVVAKVLGHSSAEMTRRVYAKLLDETVAREMLSVEAKL